MARRVFLGMSGGVDSSVSAVLLKERGYDVTGVYMKNWSEDLPGMKCPWAEDLADAKRVAVGLDIDFEVWDFEAAYKQAVVDYMLIEFKAGRTPNPDVVCNELIKFKLFYERALKSGADFIATGHYARVGDTEGESLSPFLDSPRPAGGGRSEQATCNDRLARTGLEEDIELSFSTLPAKTLLRAVDENKDQTYFLYRMSDEALRRTIFPLGELTKPEVKALAFQKGLDVANKKESMGVCFVGEVGMKDFLGRYLETEPGEIREQETGKVLGYHDGAVFYTLGQRHGLYLGGGLPYYVVGKDLEQNLVYVSKNLNHPGLWARELELTDIHWRAGFSAQKAAKMPELRVRLRHRAPLLPAGLELTGNSTRLVFPEAIKRPAAGQSAVLYSGEVCLGGGIVA